MRHSRIKYCKSNESISFEKMIFSPRGKCAFFALKIISIFLILLLTFISWTLRMTVPACLLAADRKTPYLNIVPAIPYRRCSSSIRTISSMLFDFSSSSKRSRLMNDNMFFTNSSSRWTVKNTKIYSYSPFLARQ